MFFKEVNTIANDWGTNQDNPIFCNSKAQSRSICRFNRQNKTGNRCL